jgi:hypothetical protein
LSPLYALRHQSRPPFVVVDFRITPPRARRTLRPTNRNSKAAQEPAIRAAQLSHSKVFHQDEELAAIIAQCEHRNGSLEYGPKEDPADDWLRNMPLEEQIGEAAPDRGAVETADTEMKEWKAIKASGANRDTVGPSVLHTIVRDGRPVNLGWTGVNRFSTLGGHQDPASPSKVADNA